MEVHGLAEKGLNIMPTGTTLLTLLITILLQHDLRLQGMEGYANRANFCFIVNRKRDATVKTDEII